MRTRVLDSADDVAAAGAAIVQDAVALRKTAVVGWPTGRTAVPFYEELARLNAQGRLDLTAVRGFNLDELVLPRDHPSSFATFMQSHAWGRTGLDPARCDMPRTDCDLATECRRYDEAIETAGGLDLAILGLGIDGHIAYNLPGRPIERTHIVFLPDSVAANLEIQPQYRPLRALTMGLEPLQKAKRVLIMATGVGKRSAVRAMTEGVPDPAWPCSLLREHTNLDLVIDRAASGETKQP